MPAFCQNNWKPKLINTCILSKRKINCQIPSVMTLIIYFLLFRSEINFSQYNKKIESSLFKSRLINLISVFSVICLYSKISKQSNDSNTDNLCA